MLNWDNLWLIYNNMIKTAHSTPNHVNAYLGEIIIKLKN